MENIRYELRKTKRRLMNSIKVIRRYMQLQRKKITRYPSTIQLPITYLCNFDCVMCGMHHMVNRKDFNADELKVILCDKLFCKVNSVGVNGGEPFLKKDLVECINVMLENLPELKVFNIISNGFFTEKILKQLQVIKKICGERNVAVNLSLSVDGVKDLQDFHRGHINSFANINTTITQILQDKNKYVDRLSIICTITRYNIDRITEMEIWAEELGLEVAYNIATVNVRIENEDRVKDFSIFSDEHSRMLTQEFFYKKYRESGSERYFSIYLFVKTGMRYDICPCMYNEWITLTPDTQIGFCATHSKNLGSGLKKSAYSIIQENIQYLKEIREDYCDSCSHYIYSLNSAGYKLFLKEQYKNTFLR